VSSREDRQVFDRQVDALKAAGCERVFEDRGSGASTDRPSLKECLGYLRCGNMLAVLDLDRFGWLAGELIRCGLQR
jgi:DNA invertase Pin-like site-specific DNA recombinase